MNHPSLLKQRLAQWSGAIALFVCVASIAHSLVTAGLPRCQECDRVLVRTGTYDPENNGGLVYYNCPQCRGSYAF